MEVHTKMNNDTKQVPLLPLRGLLVFPTMVLHLDVGRDKSVAAIEKAMVDDQIIFLAAQKKVSIDEPKPNEIYRIGTLAKIKQMLKLPNGTFRVLVEGLNRGEIIRFIDEDNEFTVEVQELDEVSGDWIEEEALMRNIQKQFERICKSF